MWSTVATTLVLCAISVASVHPASELTDAQREIVSEKILSFVRFNLAQRVDPQDINKKIEKPVSELIANENGRNELQAIDKYLSKLINEALSLRPITDDDFLKQILNQGQLFIKLFSTDLSAGYVKQFPKYSYDPSRANGSKIQVLPEVISTKQNHEHADDFGPALPSFPLKPDSPESMPADVFDNVQKLVPEPVVDNTGITRPKEYKLNHVIPLPVLKQFYELFSTVWQKTDPKKQRLLLAPFRVLSATSRAAQYISAGRALNSGKFNESNYDKLQKRFNYEYNFDYDVKKYYFWGMGNLVWAYQDEVSWKKFEDELDYGSEVVLGRTRFREAEVIFKRIKDYMLRVGWPKVERTQIENIVSKINKDDVLFHEMKDLLFHFVYFGLERDDPYQLEPGMWYNTTATGGWKLLKLEDYGDYEDPSYESLSEDCKTHLVDGVCHVANSTPEAESNYKKVENCMVRDIVSDQTHTVHFNHEFRQKDKSKETTSLSEVNQFIRKTLHDSHFQKACTPDDKMCYLLDFLCKHGLKNKLELTTDANAATKIKVAVKASELFYAISFPEWCTGYRFKNPNMITTDSAFMKLIIYTKNKKPYVNKEVYAAIYPEYLSNTANDKVYDLFEFVEDQFQKPNSTSSRLLMDVCKKYNFEGVTALATATDEKGLSKPSFWSKHKGAIIAGAAVVGIVILAAVFWWAAPVVAGAVAAAVADAAAVAADTIVVAGTTVARTAATAYSAAAEWFAAGSAEEVTIFSRAGPYVKYVNV